MSIRAVSAYASGLVLPLLAYLAVRDAHADLPGVTFMVAVLVATAIGTQGGFVAAIASGVLIHAGHGGEDLGDTLYFLVVSTAIPCLGFGVRRNAAQLRRSVIAARAAESERRELALKLRQKDRLDAVGQLAGGVAHDFNNMLLAIRGRAQLAASRADITAARGDLDVILESADRSAELVRRLLAFSGRQTLQPQRIDIGAVIDELLELVSGLLGAAVEVVFDAPATPAIAFVDQAQIEQVIVNLAVNARDAMPAGGRLTITIRAVQPREAGASGVMITVADTGSGIRADVAEKIFEPFFTTKEGNGSGLGLATAHGIVQQSGGQIRVAHTGTEAGTTFEVFLPSEPFASANGREGASV